MEIRDKGQDPELGRIRLCSPFLYFSFAVPRYVIASTGMVAPDDKATHLKGKGTGRCRYSCRLGFQPSISHGKSSCD